MSDPNDAQVGRSLSALSASDLAAILSKLSGKVIAEEAVQSHIKAGAPSNYDGTLNLIHFAAWLVREVSNRGD